MIGGLGSSLPVTSAATAPRPSSTPATDADSDFVRRSANARSLTQKPRWKRHVSLDAGVGHFRSRTSSVSYSRQDDSDSTISTSSTSPWQPSDEKKRLVLGHPKSPLYSPFHFPKRKPWYKKRNNLAKATAVAATVFVVGGMAGLGLLDQSGAQDWWGVKSALEEYGGLFEHASCENPYAEYGRIHVDQEVPENNRWLPYDPTCSPPPLMAALRRTMDATAAVEPLTFPLPPPRSSDPSLPLPWLVGKTVLLFGDHVERNHNRDFCRFAGGKFASIGRDHPLSPPRFVNGIDEKLPGANQENFDESRPGICYIEEYDFTLVSVFHFGLANRVEVERESRPFDPHFYPPVAIDDRLTHIVLPLLDSLNRTRPDLIEFSSSFWDLRHFTALDELAGSDPYAELSTTRLSWYSDRLTRAFSDLGAVFPNTPLLWRTMHQTPHYNQTPPVRVVALDGLSRKIVNALNDARTTADAKAKLGLLVQPHHQTTPLLERASRRATREGRSRRKTFRDRGSSQAPFLNRVKSRIGSSERVHDVVLGDDDTSLKGRIRVDEWGALMRGHTMDKVHTPPLPGGYIWGDLMLYELRRIALATAHRRHP
ncbi:hypothetical protein JCM5296_005401 [Sporobolomyces johnsonii]